MTESGCLKEKAGQLRAFCKPAQVEGGCLFLSAVEREKGSRDFLKLVGLFGGKPEFAHYLLEGLYIKGALSSIWMDVFSHYFMLTFLSLPLLDAKKGYSVTFMKVAGPYIVFQSEPPKALFHGPRVWVYRGRAKNRASQSFQA